MSDDQSQTCPLCDEDDIPSLPKHIREDCLVAEYERTSDASFAD